MLFRCALLVIFLVPSAALSQQIYTAKIENEDQLFSALLSASDEDPPTAAVLLSNHRSLITTRLWTRLTEGAVRTNEPARAVALFDAASRAASELHDQRLIASTFYKIGRYNFSQGNISAAIDNYVQSKQAFENAGLRRDLIYVLADLGTLYIYSSEFKRAKEYSEQSISLAEHLRDSVDPVGAWPDAYGVATGLSNLGNIAKRDGEYEKAIKYFQKSLSLYQKIDEGSFKYNADILDDLADIGRTYRSLGDNVQALMYLNRAMEIANSSRNVDSLADIYNSLGILYTDQRDYSKAVEFFQQGLQLSVNNRIKQAEILLNIGVAYQSQGDLGRSLDSFTKSLGLAKAVNQKDVIIHIGEGLGAIYKEQRKYKEALDALNGSLEMATQIGDKIRAAELHWRLAEVQHAKGDYSASISNASEAVRLTDQLSLQNVSYLALTTLGRAQRAEKRDDLASQTFSKAIGRIEEMRGRIVGAEQESELFFEDKVGPYQEMVDLLTSRKTSDGNAQALLYAERAKGRVLADVLSHGRADITSVMSEHEKEEERTLNRNIVALNVQMSRENSKQVSDPAQLKNLNEQLQAARLRYETFQDAVYASHPELRGRRQQTRPATLDGISQIVRDDKTAFLEYAMTKERTYLFVLTKKLRGSEQPDLRVYPIEIREKVLAKETGEFRSLIAGRDPGFADRSHELYDILIKPAEDQLRGKETLCIIPDGPLWEVPFQALQVREHRYLLQDFAVYYAPSLSVLGEMSKKETHLGSGSPSLLAFGNPKLGNEVLGNLKAVYRGETLAPLPEAETEVKTLREIWGPSRSRVLIGADANKKAFKAEASNYQIIHLATHGILDDSNPLYSRLVMSRAENDPDDDGLLEAREIMKMDLRANLVVLSACQTARGRIGG